MQIYSHFFEREPSRAYKKKREKGCEGVLSPCHKGFAMHTLGCEGCGKGVGG